MSLLAQRALATLVRSSVYEGNDGQLLIGQQVASAGLSDFFRAQGLTAKQCSDRLRQIFAEAGLFQTT